jgi:hypothetical protein
MVARHKLFCNAESPRTVVGLSKGLRFLGKAKHGVVV